MPRSDGTIGLKICDEFCFIHEIKLQVGQYLTGTLGVISTELIEAGHFNHHHFDSLNFDPDLKIAFI